jgi:iron complex outermembrane receptor protein
LSPKYFALLLAGVSPAPLAAQAASDGPDLGQETSAVQPRPGAAEEPIADEGGPLPSEEVSEEEIEGEAIVVTGQRMRGAVEGDIPAEIVLDSRDVRATGAGSIAELLDAIAPQTRSGSGRGGGRPVMLLNGRRISGFGEIRDLPPEAIERVDILPEAVALRYGYRADQRVVNIVLRRRFNAITGELEGGLATAGGRGSYEVDVNYLNIDPAGRWSLDFEYEHDDALFESERDIVQSVSAPAGSGDFRTLLAETDALALGATLNRTILGDVSATINGRADFNQSVSGLGLATDDRALERETDGRTLHLGLALNGNIQPWRWSLTANYDNVRSESVTDSRTSLVPDRSESTSSTGSAALVTNGPLFELPAGEVSATVRAGFDTRDFSSTSLRSGLEQSRDLSRDRGSLQANVDIPIASRREAFLDSIGDLSVNFNAEIERFSDFGTLRTLGAGLNWSPIEEINLGLTYTNEDGAPETTQLGDPQQLTPGVRVFDFVRGETVDINRIEGGNPNLLADNRREIAIRFNARPFEGKDLSVIAGYTDSSIRNPIAGFPTANPEIEAAFPDRFQRDSSGRLILIDSRPVNFARSDRREIRWGINFSEPIGPQRPQGGWRGRMGQGGQGGGQQGGQPGPAGQPTTGQGQAQPPQGGEQAANPQGGQPGAQRPGGGWRGGGGGRGPGGGGGGGGFRGGFGGGGFGGGGGGRLQLAFFHTWHLENQILIRDGVPVLDLLDGSATGSRGGQPRHEVEVQAGIFKDGLGARLSGNWRSGTFVRGIDDPLGGTGSNDLFFSDSATVNLRLFADLGQQRSLVRAVPFFRGTRISVAIDNLFDSRPGVRDSTGTTPLGYQPDYLDPLGRSVRISLRKLFF